MNPSARRIALLLVTAPLALVPIPGEPRAGPSMYLPGELNLRWNDCWGDAGAQNRAFACNTNLGSERLVASFVSPDAVPGVNGFRAQVRFGFGFRSVFPGWWDFMGATACRPTSLTIGSSPPATAASCLNWTNSGPLYQVTYQFIGSGAYGAGALLDINGIVGSPSDLDAGQEYFAFSIQINHARTVGTGACAGCDGGACMAFVYLGLMLANPPPEAVYLYGTAQQSEVVTWQNGSGVPGVPTNGGPIQCFGVTGAKRSTWAAVKALYR